MSAPIEIPEHVLSNAPWSISKAGVIEKCSQQYDYKYGPNKIKELTVFQPAAVGVTVHKALELALDNTPVSKAFKIALESSELTSNEVTEVNAFIDQVDRFVAKMLMFRRRHNVHPANVFIERRMALTPTFTATEFFDKKGFFRGVVDYALLTGTNDLIIIDHKSGKEKPLEEYEAQFRTYCLLAAARFPELRGVQTAINFVAPDKLVWNKYVPRAVIETEYRPWLVDYITKACEKLLAPPVAKAGWYCNYCGYKSICTAFGGTGRVPENTDTDK